HRLIAFGFAILTSLGFVFKTLISVEELLTGGKNKICTAVDALECPVLEIHGRPPGRTGPFVNWVQRDGKKAQVPPSSLIFALRSYSGSCLVFSRLRLRAKAAFTRRFSPGFK